ncbi:hypothetical protein Ddc_14469 [Ditylenchus destructor]|nr:hypothetical protein Ddc_14469 [Ditylenchus destructor]
MDNGTLVEVFKNLNYCQLAKSSLVSKRFSNLIHTHRHSLALLYVDSVSMKRHDQATAFIKIFKKQLSPKAYNEWVIRNNYSKQIPPDDQVARIQSKQYEHNVYRIGAHAVYKDGNRHCLWDDITTVFYASTNLNHENWPLFQHFVRLLTDPFIHIRCLELTPQNDVLSLLAGAINQDRFRLQCGELRLNLHDNTHKFIGWIKDHVVCKKIEICNYANRNYDEELLDLFVTGAHCTSEISITYYVLSRVVVNLMQKFMDLKNRNEYQFIESIVIYAEDGDVEALTESFVKFIVNEEVNEDNGTITHTFEFVNNDVGKKLLLTVRNLSYFSLKIDNLITNIATMDNGTIVEVFKYLSYCGLAKNSLVSKRFRDLIRYHRRKLALMCVNSIRVTAANIVIHQHRSVIKIFDQKLSPEAYNEWIVRNNYSEKVQLENQVAGKQSTQNEDKVFQLSASAVYENLSYPWDDPVLVFSARAVLNHENCPLFQHIVRLLTDPFIYIRSLELTLQDDELNLFVGATSSDRIRLRCGELKFDLNANAQKLLCWIKDHVVCKKIEICNYYRSNFDQELLDLFMSGAHFTSAIRITYYVLSKVVVNLIQKFLDLKSCDEYQFVESIEGNAGDEDLEVLTGCYAKFLVKKEANEYSYEYDYGDSVHVFEFINNDVGKKLKFTVTKWSYTRAYYSLKIDNL